MLQEVRTSVGIGGGTFAAAADAGQLPFRDASIDVLLAAFILCHVPDVDVAVAEFRRVTRPGGTLLIALNRAGDKTELRLVRVPGGTAQVFH
jgi:ubiquinone/menaquinone biosynthesis C-methylase UbiE